MEPLPLRSELLPQQLPPATDQHDPLEPAPPGQSPSQEPPHREDATAVICGLILELSNLNRLAMSTHRGLEMLRRPKPRQSRRPVPACARRRWKET
ncbi:hypothetical protein AV530_012293 [Patagioenas fasciata monilis]|uniref:Uncharacterized protein n=1 Tax=Patagioenas fasciata monilis TaxID=372326 RepID=A0A1V4JZL9_PATFA|nr:hypothetical protein AV530_012293 [Patagioenas fasciata monilis]